MMKSFMSHIHETKPDDECIDNFRPFSNALLGYTIKSESAWALNNIDDSLFMSSKIFDVKTQNIFGKIKGGKQILFNAWSKTLLMKQISDKFDLETNEGKLIVFEVSKFPIVTVPGSDTSIDLIN